MAAPRPTIPRAPGAGLPEHPATMTPERWRVLQPLLDEALDAEPAARAELLQTLAQRDAALAADLRGLLDELSRVQGSDFLQPGADAAAALGAAPRADQRLGPYRLTAPLGEGGMGSVWRARRDDGRYDAEVAVKLLSFALTDSGRAERFQREGRILARLAHPNIARLLDAGVAPGGQPYLVLELVSGQHIDAWCDERRLDLSGRLRLLLDLADALQHAHRHLVVHRDIKPSNVMVDAEGRLKLLDFGIAKLLATDSDATALAPDDALTQRLGAVHTPGYAAPEQLQRGEVSTATDVFAFGALACLLLCGQHPTLRRGMSAAQAMQATLEREAPPMSQLARGDAAAAAARGTSSGALVRALAGDLDTLVAKALRRDAAERYASAAALAEDLRRHLASQPILARKPSPLYLLRRLVQRRPGLVAASAAGAVVLALAGSQAWRQQRAVEDSRNQAQAIEGLLASVFHGMDPTVAANRSFSAAELLDRASGYLEGGAGLDPETRRAARLRLAELYRDIGAYEQAFAAFEAEAEAAASDGDAAAVERARWSAAGIASAQRRFDVAERLLDTMDRAAPSGGEAFRGATARRELLRGELALAQLQVPQARQLLARAAAGLAQAAQAAKGPPAGSDLELLARVAHAQGMAARLAHEDREAMTHLREAAALQARRGDAGLVDGLAVGLEIGTLENRAGRHADAERTLMGVHAPLLARLGPNHALTVSAVSELALAGLRQGRFDAVESWIQRLRGSTGPADAWRDEHADLLAAMALMYQGRADAAEPKLRRLLAALEREAGGASLATEPLRRLHGEALLRLGRTGAAEAVLRSAESNQLRLGGQRRTGLALTRVLLGTALARRGDLPAAKALWVDASAQLERELGSAHPQALVAAAYAALANGLPSDAPERQAMADALVAELGWLDGIRPLAERLRQPPAKGGWATLPAAL